MSDLGYNIWGVVASAIGTVALLPVLVTWFNARLPSARIAPVVELLKEVEELFFAALREKLLKDKDELRQFNLCICTARIKVHDARAKAHSARTWKQDVSNWWDGLSDRILALQEELNATRVKLAERNSRARRQRASQHSLDEPPVSLLADKEHTCPSYQTDLTSPQLDTRDLGYSTPTQAPRPPCSHCGHLQPLRKNHTCGGCSRPDKTCKDDCASTDSLLRHHLISDIDIQGMLSLALTNPSSGRGGRKRHRATRHRLLLRFGRELYGSQSPGTTGSPAESMPYGYTVNQSRFKAFAQLLRSVYGAGPGKDIETSLTEIYEPRPQCTQQAGGGPVHEEGEWQEET
ncbi:hypothetical protein C8Q78DRAFT_369808 [Trametes maxima]|nr:hypothetical protein C8Q78DRAFT_369808 [Trametes maxima]